MHSSGTGTLNFLGVSEVCLETDALEGLAGLNLEFLIVYEELVDSEVPIYVIPQSWSGSYA